MRNLQVVATLHWRHTVTVQGVSKTVLDAYHRVIDRFNEALKKQVVVLAE